MIYLLGNIVTYTVFGRDSMINDKVKEVLNEQINKEFYSAYLYLAMSAYFDDLGLCGFANWTKVQAREEVDHGMIIFDYFGFIWNNKSCNTFNAEIEKSHSNNSVRKRLLLAGRPLSNPNTKIYIGARWIKLKIIF